MKFPCDLIIFQLGYFESTIELFSYRRVKLTYIGLRRITFFFLIGKVISLKAKRQRKEYTRSIPRYKEVKHQRANKPHP